MANTVITEFLDEQLALIRLGASDERVVTLTSERMESFRAALATCREKKVTAIIIVGSQPDMFAAGADITVFQKVQTPEEGEKLAKQGQDIFDELEHMSATTVAAISGPCVGGGCELVLACDYRLITDNPSSQIGLPETKLGILPGFGGTQRLPRLLGLPNALDLICAGKTLRSKQALQVKLVDSVVSFEKLEETSRIFAKKPKRKTVKHSIKTKLLTYSGFGRSIVKKAALKKVTAGQGKFYPAPALAIDSAVNGLTVGMKDGLVREAKLLGELMVSDVSRELVNLFFIGEKAKNLGKQARKEVEQVSALVVGAGTMGAGIAAVLLSKGAKVALRDINMEALQRGKQHVEKVLGGQRSLSAEKKAALLDGLQLLLPEAEISADTSIVIEAALEDLELKKKLFAELSQKISPTAILASNTSSLSVTAMAEGVTNPERVIGMHFFNPAEKMPLVEIIRAQQTNVRSIAVIAALTNKIGKTPIVVEDVPGFLVNRILFPYLSEALELFAAGYSTRAIDKAALDFGMPMGPLRLLDEIGFDVAKHVSKVMVDGYGSRMQGPDILEKFLAKGMKGKKSGSGFYSYASEKGEAIENIRVTIGMSSRELAPSDDLADLLLLPLINEAVRCLDEGVAGAPGPDAAGQINIGSIFGIGFPAFRGGVLRYADKRTAKTLLEKLESLEELYGARFSPADGIKKRAADGTSFC